MLKNHPHRFAARFLAAVALGSAIALPQQAAAQGAGIDSQAQKLLKTSMDFLGSQQKFSADTRNSLEIVLKSGQKLQFDNVVTMSLQRPNKLYAKRVGDIVDQVFYYDGKSLTLHNPSAGYYASVAAPGTVEAMLDQAREKLNIFAPGGDLLYKDAYQYLMDGVTDGFVVGKGTVEGVRCDHLAFRAPHVDWQMWIQEGKQPLPRKVVITTRDIVNAPQFTVVMTKWNLAPTFNESVFSFKPPKNARKVDFIPL